MKLIKVYFVIFQIQDDFRKPVLEANKLKMKVVGPSVGRFVNEEIR